MVRVVVAVAIVSHFVDYYYDFFFIVFVIVSVSSRFVCFARSSAPIFALSFSLALAPTLCHDKI